MEFIESTAWNRQTVERDQVDKTLQSAVALSSNSNVGVNSFLSL